MKIDEEFSTIKPEDSGRVTGAGNVPPSPYESCPKCGSRNFDVWQSDNPGRRTFHYKCNNCGNQWDA